MQYALVAAVVGVVAGLATGGHLRHLGDRPIRRWPLLVGAAVLQLSAEAAGHSGITLLLVLAAGAGLIAFAASNVRLIGMGVVLVGLGLNLVVMAANGAMPVRANALVRADVVDSRAEAARHDLGARRRLEEPADRLTGLGDIVPVPGLRQVVSFGDLVVLAGVADVLAHLTHKRRPRSGVRRGGAGKDERIRQ
jgi:hypothetical protein